MPREHKKGYKLGLFISSTFNSKPMNYFERLILVQSLHFAVIYSVTQCLFLYHTHPARQPDFELFLTQQERRAHLLG